MSEYVFPTKFCIAVGFSAVCLLLLCHESSRKRVCGMSWAVLSFAFVMPRLLAFGLLYIAVQLPAQSDVGVYLEHARLVMAGKRPFIDFETAYGPWFLVLCSWALRLWNS